MGVVCMCGDGLVSPVTLRGILFVHGLTTHRRSRRWKPFPSNTVFEITSNLLGTSKIGSSACLTWAPRTPGSLLLSAPFCLTSRPNIYYNFLYSMFLEQSSYASHPSRISVSSYLLLYHLQSLRIQVFFSPTHCFGLYSPLFNFWNRILFRF